MAGRKYSVVRVMCTLKWEYFRPRLAENLITHNFIVHKCLVTASGMASDSAASSIQSNSHTRPVHEAELTNDARKLACVKHRIRAN